MPQAVVGAVIVDQLTRPSYVVAARRTTPPELAGRWEFPGGDVGAGETAQGALAREIREELGVSIAVDSVEPRDLGAKPSQAELILPTLDQELRSTAGLSSSTTSIWAEVTLVQFQPEAL